MPFYTSEQILNQAFDQGTGTLKTSGPSGAAAATAANQTTTNDRLGTPGTGEPAHAGGSTGLIGWARDILAKIAAFGTSAAPSADVLSMQEGQLVTSSVLSTSGATHVALCSGMSEVVFRIYDNAGGPSVIPSSTTVAAEGWHSAHGSEATSTNWVPIRTVQDSAISYLVQWGESTQGQINPNTWHPNQYIASCVGFEKVRIRLTGTPASPYKVISAVHPSSNRVSRLVTAKLVCDANTTSTSQAQPLYTYTTNNTAVYYNDSVTPLAASATFTGSTRTMATGNNFFNAVFFSDANGAALGAQIQNAPDGTNWRGASPADALQGYIALVHRAVRTSTTPSYRVIYANGGTAQTFFSLTSSQTPN